MNAELSRKIAKTFNEYPLDIATMFDWGIESLSADSVNELSQELQNYLDNPKHYASQVAKHLAGQHDQKTHGKGGLHLKDERESLWAKNGITGLPSDSTAAQWKSTVASDLSKRMSAYGVTDEQFIDYHKKHVFAPTLGAYQEPTKKWEGSKPANEIVTLNVNSEGHVTFSALSQDNYPVTWEQSVNALDISNEAYPSNKRFMLQAGGQEILNNDVTKRLVSEWAVSSNDESAASLTIQERAKELFGITNSASWNISESVSKEMEFHANQTHVYDAFLRSQYDATQEFFKSEKITEITLYRGIHLDPKPFVGGSLFESPEQFFNGFDTKFTSRPLSSWTTRLNQAEMFSVASATKGQRSYVLKKVFPVDKIISTPFTGNGCLREFEMVAMGGEQDVFAIDGENASGIDDVA